MMYLSKGIPTPPKGDRLFHVSHCGAYALGSEMYRVWEEGRNAPRSVSEDSEAYVRRLVEYGLAAVSEETGGLAGYRLLAACVPCPDEASGELPHDDISARVWNWLNGAGLRLTVAELVRLEELEKLPTPELLGEDGMRELVDTLDFDDACDNILETQMERSPARDATASALFRLLQSGHIFLV